MKEGHTVPVNAIKSLFDNYFYGSCEYIFPVVTYVA